MIKVLLKIFFKDTNDGRNDLETRTKYSVFAGVIGVLCNGVLFVIKLGVGAVTSSIAIVSDAFNNLSDMGTSVVSIIGAKISTKKPDKEHPFGHGRVEYISSLIVSFIIMLVGFELLKSSFSKIFVPQPISLKPVPLALLCLSLPIKYWMYSYNRYIGKLISSSVLMATARDSINDVIATFAIIVSAVLGKFFNIPQIDGLVGTTVSVMIMFSGFKISLDTIGVLLGSAPSQELTGEIRQMIVSAEGIEGIHDLIVHDYGPGRIFASVHAEVPDNCDVVEIHELIDELETRIEKTLGVHIVIHMDPLSLNCERTSAVREIVMETVKSVDESLNIHDFRMTEGVNSINLIFDVEVPLEYEKADGLKEEIISKIRQKDPRYNVVMRFDYV